MTDKQIEKVENCKYRLPCGWCDRLNDTCIFDKNTCDSKGQSLKIDPNKKPEPVELPSIDNYKHPLCSHVWVPMNSINTTGGQTYRCQICGTIKTEYGNVDWTKLSSPKSDYSLWDAYVPDSCKNCSNHPSNGGNGICLCTLGLPTITCGTSACDSSIGINISTSATEDSNFPFTYTTSTVKVTDDIETLESSNCGNNYEQLTIEGI